MLVICARRWAFTPYIALTTDGVVVQNRFRQVTIAFSDIARVHPGYGGRSICTKSGGRVTACYYGGYAPGVRGRGEAANKFPVIVAVERSEPRGWGRCRLKDSPTLRSADLRAFLVEIVAPGSMIVTDGNAAYRTATQGLYEHQWAVVPGAQAND